MITRAAVGLLICASISWCQQYLISTVAGGAPLPQSIAATSVPLHQIGGLAADSSGNIYFTSSNCVFKLDQSGLLTRIAGNTRAGYSGDGGPAMSAKLSGPAGIALDGSGNIFIADSGNYRVRRVSPAGIITTIAGSGQFGTPVSGAAAVNASLGTPVALAFDSAGRLSITDTANNLVLRVPPNGIITIVAGTGAYGYSGDGGPAVRGRLSAPQGLAFDSKGNIFISESGNSCIRKVAADGTITTFAGTGFPGYSGDGGQAEDAQFDYPEGIVFDNSGNLLIADSGNSRLRRVAPNGVITTVAGTGASGFSGDGGPGIAAQLAGVGNVVLDSRGNIVLDSAVRILAEGFFLLPTLLERVGDFSSGFLLAVPRITSGSGVSVLRSVSLGGTITTIAGNNSTGLYGVGTAATNAQFGSVQGVAADSSGNLFIADPVDDDVLKVSTAGIVSVVAGNGNYGFSGDGGLATSAQLSNPVAVAVDVSGNLFIADQYNGRIRKVSSAGIITTVAGTGSAGYAGDGGLATNAEISKPARIALDGAGNLFILDTANDVVRKVSSNGIVTTVAGNGTPGYSGDRGAAINAQLNNPTGLAVDAAGNLFIADTYNYAVRKVSVAGTITTIAGGPSQYGSAGDGGPATAASLSQPVGVATDSSGNVFISDNGAIRRVSFLTGIITTVSDANLVPNSGGGAIIDIAVDRAGNVFLADTSDSTVQKLTASSQTVLVSAVVDAASEQGAAVSPGKIVVIYGSGMGPSNGVLATPSGGVFGTKLAGTTVFFNGIPAVVYYASATQVAAIVPYSISGITAFVTVAYQSGISSGFSVAVAATSPGIFTYNATGAGQAAAINVSGGSLNSATNPVKPGDFISLYASGEGQTSPAGVDGKVWPVAAMPLPPPTPLAKVGATVGGLPATVNYAGGVPLSVGGLMQVNIQIPKGVTPSGYVPVVLTIGNASTADGAVWIAVSN